MTVQAAVAVRPTRRRFYVGIAIAIVITVFAGFSRSYYLRTFYHTTPLAGLVHLHGVIFSSWVLLFLGQSTLVAAGRTALHRRLGAERHRARLLLQVHDELVLEAPPEELDAVAALVREEMEGAAVLDVPLVVDVGTGQNWREAK